MYFIFNRLKLRLTAFTALLTQHLSSDCFWLFDFTLSDWINKCIWLCLHLSSVLLPSCAHLYYLLMTLWDFIHLIWLYLLNFTLILTEYTSFLTACNNLPWFYPSSVRFYTIWLNVLHLWLYLPYLFTLILHPYVNLLLFFMHLLCMYTICVWFTLLYVIVNLIWLHLLFLFTLILHLIWLILP